MVITSPFDDAGGTDAGAVTWGSGTSGVSGAVTSSNSLVGTTADDLVGNQGVTALSNGNYVVSSPSWDNAAGAVTWGSGTSGVSGAVTSSNSLVGTSASDYVGGSGVTALTNGNYVVSSASWNNAGVQDAGAVTWGSGAGGVKGAVTISNSLIGSAANDKLGATEGGFFSSSYGSVMALSNGNYVVNSAQWDNASVVDAGAVTWGSGTSGVQGFVTSSNSLVGLTSITNLIALVTDDVNSIYYGRFLNDGSGRVQLGSQLDRLSILPEIAISLTGPLTDGTSNVRFDSVPAGSNSAPLTFTITNPVDADLTSLVVTKDGPGAADFTVSALSATNIPVGAGTATFTVTFSPTSIGARTATLHIASNVIGSKNPFDISITGSGRIASRIPQTLVFTAPLKLYLAESPFTLSASASSGLPVAFIVLSGPASVSENVLSFTGAGLVKVRAIQAGNSGYLPATSLDRTITVAASPTTLTLTNLSQTYTSKPRPITVLGTTGTTVAVVSYKVGLTYGSTAPTNVGSYPVKAVVGDITKTGTLLITKAPLFVTPDDQRKFAGQVNPALKFVYSGFLGSDKEGNSVSKAPVIATTATATSPGGLYPITASLGTTANYIFVYLSGTMKVESFAGNYEALLVDANSKPVGKLSITVSPTIKTFTAKLATATETSAVSFVSSNLITGVEKVTGTATTLVGTGKIPYLIDFTLPTSGNVITSIKSSNLLLGSAADGRKLSTAKVAYAGAHTAVLEPATPTGRTVPAGAGWATASISTTGVITLTGKLGDGTGFTSALSPDDLSNPGYRLFVQPYITARTQSFLAGSFALTEHPTIAGRRYLAESSLTWKKTKLDKDNSYGTTFGPVNTVLMIDPWLEPKTTIPTSTLAQRLGLKVIDNVISFGVTHSATGSDSQTSLPSRLALSTANAVRVRTHSSNPTKWKTLTFVPKTGTFTGSFELTDAIKRPVTFSGILRQPATLPDALIGEGHYLLPPLTGTEITTGEVMFTRP
jgi:hypothetical protein